MENSYFSQFRQDEFLNEVVFDRKRNGFFIDIGAHDGVSISNSLFFEKQKDWNGICIEPNPNVYSQLVKNRQSVNINKCIGNQNKTVTFTQILGYSEMLSGITENYHQNHLRRIDALLAEKGGEKTEIEVEMVTLDSIEAARGKCIDFISIDTEGNEFDIVQSIDFAKLDIRALVIENNYKEPKIKDHLEKHGFALLHKLDTDEVFVCKADVTASMKLRLFEWKLRETINARIGQLKNKLRR